MASASINTVYSLVQRIANKEQRGFISPSAFNQYAQHAQLEVTNELLEELKVSANQRKRYLEESDGVRGGRQAIIDELAPLLKASIPLVNISSNNFSEPDDLLHIDDIFYGDGTNFWKADIVNPARANHYLNSELSAPSEQYPIVLQANGIFSVFPSTITSGMSINYYKIPQGVTTAGAKTTQQPTWAYSTPGSSSSPVYNATNTIDFELSSASTNRLVVKILSYIGISLREQEVQAYAAYKEKRITDDVQ
jgi:hypothetical protein